MLKQYTTIADANFSKCQVEFKRKVEQTVGFAEMVPLTLSNMMNSNQQNFEPPHGKTNNLHRLKQRLKSVSTPLFLLLG